MKDRKQSQIFEWDCFKYHPNCNNSKSHTWGWRKGELIFSRKKYFPSFILCYPDLFRSQMFPKAVYTYSHAKYSSWKSVCGRMLQKWGWISTAVKTGFRVRHGCPSSLAHRLSLLFSWTLTAMVATEDFLGMDSQQCWNDLEAKEIQGIPSVWHIEKFKSCHSLSG